MIRRLFVYEADRFDPYWNLATEQYLLESVKEGCCILFLWQNQNTVVIGRNQNPWVECRTTLLEEEGGHLARRLSGGGAVFHDLGNLNFTFLVGTEDYDLDKQLRVIERAVGRLGIKTERSGRNDVLAEGRKFSGNAFYKNGAQSYHHGTLLVDVDTEKMSRYLQPSKAKLAAKGVDSVRSRVVNLKTLCPGLTIETLKAAMVQAFAEVYELPIETLDDTRFDLSTIQTLCQRNESWQWLFGRKMPFSVCFEDRFAWGGVRVEMQVKEGQIEQVKVYSDAMDWQIAPLIEQALCGCQFTLTQMKAAICCAKIDRAEDFCQLLDEQRF